MSIKENIQKHPHLSKISAALIFAVVGTLLSAVGSVVFFPMTAGVVLFVYLFIWGYAAISAGYFLYGKTGSMWKAGAAVSGILIVFHPFSLLFIAAWIEHWVATSTILPKIPFMM